MIPKEKAKELVDKIFDEIGSAYSGYRLTAASIALIMVDEIEAAGVMIDRTCGYLPITIKHKEYWQQVREEILKLYPVD